VSDGSASIVPLRDDRADEVAALMGRAFQDDPWAVFSCPDPDERARWLPWVFRPTPWQACLCGVLLGTAGRLDGVVAAVSPSGGEFTADQLDQFGYGAGRAALGAETWDRIMAGARAAYRPLDAALKQAVTEPHWYLDTLAVDPARQGHGIGSRLLAAVHARADADGVPVVLATFQPKTLTLYRRHGYVMIGGEEAPAGRPSWWGLRRNPRGVEGG
jgi:GNAT superfamily N-acetyltransferase